jgi:hypothetical protein
MFPAGKTNWESTVFFEKRTCNLPGRSVAEIVENGSAGKEYIESGIS